MSIKCLKLVYKYADEYADVGMSVSVIGLKQHNKIAVIHVILSMQV